MKGHIALSVAAICASAACGYHAVYGGEGGERLHVVLAPILLVVYAVSPIGIMYFLDRSAPGIPSVRELRDQTVVIVRTPSSLGAAYRFGVPLDDPPTAAQVGDRMYAYIAKDRPDAPALFDLLKDGKAHPVTVAVHYPKTKMSNEVLAMDDAITSVTVAVRKLRPPVAEDVATVGVRCTLARP